MSDDDPDPGEMEAEADRYDELVETMRDVRAGLGDLQDSDLVRAETAGKLDLVDELLALVEHGEGWGYHAHWRRERAKQIRWERELEAREGE